MNNTYKITLCAIALCILPILSFAEELRINIPDSSNMHLYAPDSYISLVSFEGRAEMEGTLLAVSQSNTIDDETQWCVGLFFKPKASAQNVLPQVRFKGERSNPGAPLIELNMFQKAQIKSDIETIFGAEIASKMGKEPVEVAAQGYLTLEFFRTGIECDRRYYYARLVAFEKKLQLQQSRARDLAQKVSIGCS